VWYAPFERGVNEEIAKRRPECAPLIERINRQFVEFFKRHYVHPGFRGSTSIKDALRAYCKLYTYAMYAIWRVLHDHCFGAKDARDTSSDPAFAGADR
jgi:hypothetical protein